MPFNVNTFKTRALSAIVFVVVMCAGLLINEWSFLLLFLIIHIGCWLEYQKLVGMIYPEYKKLRTWTKIIPVLLGVIFLLLSKGFLQISFDKLSFNYQLFFRWALIGYFLLSLLLPNSNSFAVRGKILGYSILGLLYISLSIGLLIRLYSFKPGLPAVFFPLFIIVCMWINDTMAYIVGSFIGKTPFSKISPKKTWEGTVGGVILCTIVVGLLTPICFKNDIPKIHWYILALIAAVTGTIGDLLESKLKRTAGVKDSGNMMPGHGGFLDRFDSLLLATPFVFLYVVLAF